MENAIAGVEPRPVVGSENCIAPDGRAGFRTAIISSALVAQIAATVRAVSDVVGIDIIGRRAGLDIRKTGAGLRSCQRLLDSRIP